MQQNFKRRTLCIQIMALTCLSTAALAEVSVKVTDPLFYPAGSMLAYTEFELSGEPLAEVLGLDLDVLDPNALAQPTPFDYSAGIESYEYSEEAMYALNYQSRMGPHLVNGLRNAQRGGEAASLGKRFAELAASVRYPLEEIPLNLYPISLPYRVGLPEFEKTVDVTPVNKDQFEREANGKPQLIQTEVPAYYRDYATLGWKESGMIREFEPAAIGGILLKEVMWSQDFLGGMHKVEGDEEVAAESADMDKTGEYALGVSSVDGLNGVILTELSLEKMQWLQEKLAYDGHKLGASLSPAYDASQPVWFPHRVAVTETQRLGFKQAEALKVIDTDSTLRDSWMLLWPVSEYLAFADQRVGNKSQNPAFKAVFDGAPFAATAAENRDNDAANDIIGTDGFALSNTLSRVLFQNLIKLHKNDATGLLVTQWDGQSGNEINTFDLAYSIVALGIFQKAQDALPVGYASAEFNATGLETSVGKEAKALLEQQTDLLLKHLKNNAGLIVDGATIDAKGKLQLSPVASMATQFAAIRALGTAFSATQNVKYRTAARDLWVALEAQHFDAAVGTWADRKGTATTHTPFTAAAISGGLRIAMLQLRNEGQEQQPALELAHLVQRYTQWFSTVINGPAETEGMQRAEWLGDSGEHIIAGQGRDTDQDKVPQITGADGKGGVAMVMAGAVEVVSSK
jgi:hypothetical protein